MKKILFLLTSAVVLFSTLPMVSFAQTTGDFRTNGAVTFAAATNWQTYNGTAWVAAAAAPTSADGAILINGPHTASVTTNVTLDQVSVDGILQVNSGATLTLADGTGDDLFVRNRLFFQATGVITGAGQLVLGNQAIVQTANVGGLAASITSTNPTLTAGASYWFNGATAQSTGFTGFASLGNPLHFSFKNTAGITIDRNLTITGTLTANKNVPIIMGAGVTSFTANAIYNGGSFNNCVGATISPAFTATGWASPKGVYQSPDSSKPTTESSNIWTNSHKTTAHIYWMQSGSGNNRIVVLKAGSAVSPTAPIDNTTYTANAAFGTGTAIDGGFVVYNGAGSQVNVTGLIEGTTYHVAVFEYNQDCGTNRNYKTGSPLTSNFVASERPFITEWITTDGSITIPTFTGGTYNYTVNYRQILPSVGTTTTLTGQTGNCTISGLTNGNTYEVSITGTFPRIHFGGSNNTNAAKIRNIKQWGSVQWTSMEEAFGNQFLTNLGCINLNSNAIDIPNLSNITVMSGMFGYCLVFNGGNIANWNTQNVTQMDTMFASSYAFNQAIGSWNTSSIQSMGRMFRYALAFNQVIGNWNTSNLISTYEMFMGCNINNSLEKWNTINVTFMINMFFNATAFNQPIGTWNTGNVTDMSMIFYNATSFNQSIGTWNTQNVTNMFWMFRQASAFNQSLATWNVTNLNTGTNNGAYQMLDNCGMNQANYDATLIGWAAQNVKTGVQLGAAGRVYSCSVAPTRQSLITGKSWVITGDAGDCISVSTTTLSAFSACLGSASVAQSYTISGANLTADIVITAPTNFEVSVTSATAGFAATQTLTQSGGNVGSTTVYIRQTSAAPNGASGTVTHTSTGMLTKNVSIPVSNTTDTPPTITGISTTSVNSLATTFNLSYTGTSNAPNQYSITTGTPNAMPSFVAVSNATLAASPLAISIPASAAATYNFNLTVTNSTTGCVSAVVPFTLVVTAATTVPTLAATPTHSNVHSYTAVMGGDVTVGTGLSEVGIVWGLTANPTIANNKVVASGIVSTGAFSIFVQGLPAATTVHYRAYATNGDGTSYSTSASFTTLAALTQSYTNGQNAEFVVGQPNFTTGTSGLTAQKLNFPFGVAIDYRNGKLYVADFSNHRVLRFAYPIIVNNPVAELVFGQPDMTSGTSNNSGLSASSLANPAGIFVDNTGRLWVADYSNQRVLWFNNAHSIATNKPAANGVLGQANFTTGNFVTTQNGMSGPLGIVIDNEGNLFVSEAINHRILRFNRAATKANGANADGVLGQANFTSGSINRGGTAGANTLSLPSDLAIQGTTLWVGDQTNHRVVRYNNAANKANGANADGVLGQANFTSSTINRGGSTAANTMNRPYGVSVDFNGNLWVVDNSNRRVLRFDNALSKADGAAADGVLGQSVFTTATAATTQSGLDIGAGITTDWINNKVLVVDYFNHRMMQFAGATPSNITLTDALTAFTTCVNQASTHQTYKVSGSNLIANIDITAPMGFEISTDNGMSYNNSRTLTQTGGAVSETNVRVRVAATATAGTVNGGDISHTSTGSNNPNRAIPASTVNALPVATFSYAASPYCKNAVNPSPTFSGGGIAGIFSSTTGLVFVNAATGQIDLTASTAGTYTVTNTIAAAGGCGIVNATANVTITTLPVATISYTTSPFCKTVTSGTVTQTGTAGGTYSSTTGLTINAATGEINPSTSTAGTYVVTYSIAAAGGCGVVNATANVTITTLPVGTFGYASATYCLTAINPNPTFTGGGVAGNFTVTPAGLNFVSATTGQINLATSVAGNYTVTNTIAAAAGCPAVVETTLVSLTNAPIATFNYGATPYCKTAANPSPTFTGGGTAGTFTSTAGLVFVSAATGQVDITASTAGTYTVTNTITGGGCTTTMATANITITTLPVATISYATSPFCKTVTLGIVTQTGTTGGNYSATPAGLVINAATGEINPSTSTAGTYLVTYSIAAAGGCGIVNATANVTITTLPVATISYTTSPFCKTVTSGTVTQTGTAGGTYSSTTGLTINAATGEINPSTSTAGTYVVTYSIAAAGGCGVVNATANVTITTLPVGTFGYASATYCLTAINPNPTFTGGGVAGNFTVTPAGLNFVSATTGQINLATSVAGNYTVTNTIAAAAGCPAVVETTLVSLTNAPIATFNYGATPYCKTAANPSPTFTGGGTAGTFTSTAGLVFVSAATGQVDITASTAGTYTVTNTITGGGCTTTMATANVTITTLPVATFGYASATYCLTAINPNPTFTGGGVAGNFTVTPAGLNFVSATTGQINLATSVAGNYTVTNTIAAAVGCPAVVETTLVSLTNAPIATFNYGATPYCKTAANPSPTFTGGGTAGTFTSTAGLVFVSAATGQVDITASTAGTYTVTNTITGGGCTTTMATANVTITTLPVATISYATSPFCKTVTSGIVTQTGTTGGNYSATPAGLTINAATGEITPSTSTTGTYLVTYSIAAAGGCGVVNATANVTITTLPVATISYATSPFCKTVTSGIVTQTGTTGGNYSATPAGLTINAATGEITPSTSTAGTYLVTYSIAAAGGCGVVNATANVTITTAPVGTFGYASATYCLTAINPNPTFTGGGVAGNFTVTPAGLNFVSATTGQINLATSVAGNYTVTNTIAAAAGCPAVVETTLVSLTNAPIATFNYGATPYCKTAANPSPTFTGGGTAGTFTSTAGLVFVSAATGQVDITASTAGTYTVTNTITGGGCTTTMATANITITTLPVATISYATSPFCKTVTLGIVTQTGTTGGNYSATPAGLVINAATGEINPSTSTAGTYLVTYSIAAAGGCGIVNATANVTITTLPVATVSYATSPFCKTVTSGIVTQTGTTGGNYSATPAGLTINTTTGEINPSTSTAGTYLVTYSIAAAGGCGVVNATANVTITTAPVGTFGYASATYCLTAINPNPTFTGGGVAGNFTVTPAGLNFVSATTGQINLATSVAGNYTVTNTITAAAGCPAVVETTLVSLTNAPIATFNYGATPYCKTAANPSPTFTGGGTAGTFTSTAGLVFVSAATGQVDITASTAGTYTVTNTITSGGCTTTMATANVTITTLPVATISYATSPFCKTVTSGTVTQTGTAGGTYSSTAGLVINAATGEINPSTSTAGTYLVTYSIAAAGGCGVVNATANVTITTLPTATISYATSPFCKTVTSGIVTQTGTTGGNYSATPTGLTINTTTGEINPSTSTAGTYLVTYSIAAAGGCGIVNATANVTITTLPTATISYAGSPFCSTVTSGIVTQTGTTGGTYSSTTGLTINTTTGEINPSTSTAGNYVVTYSIAAAGGCGIVNATANVTITTLPVATISYATSPFCSTVTSGTVTQTGTAGGNYSATPAGLTINATNGEINPSTSTAGTYVVTYTIAAAGGCGIVNATANVSIVIPNIAPTINTVSPVTTSANAPTQTVNLSGIGMGLGDVGQTLTVTATSSNLALMPNPVVTYTSPNATATLQFTPIASQIGTSTITVTVTDNGFATCGTNVQTITFAANIVNVPPPPPAPSTQFITFDSIPNQIFANQLIEMLARANSTLPVTFTVVSGNATLAGQNFLTVTGLGEIVVTASQAGGFINNVRYLAAAPVTRRFTVSATSQTLTGFEVITDRAWNTPNFSIKAIANSNLPVTFTVTEGANIAEIINGNIVKLKSAIGRVTITATQLGNATTNAATPIVRSFNVIKADQNINNIATLPTLTFRPNLTQRLSATATSELPVVASIVSGNATITNNVISFSSAGSVVVRYSQAGNDLWNAATSVERTFVVEKATQNIILTSAPNEVIIGTPQTVIASATSGLPVSMRVISGTATVNGLVVTATDGENIVIELNQAGDANYNPAIPVRFSIGINPTLTLTSVSGTKFCGGAVITVNFAVTGLFLGNNRMAAYLSDANGIFTNDRQLIGTVDARNSGVITGLIPANIPSGRGYKVRLEAISPRIFSVASTQTLELNAVPEVATISQDGAALVSSIASGVQWFANGVVISGATSQKFTPTKAQSDANNLYSVVITNASGCTSVSGFANYQPPIVTGIDNPTLSAKLAIYPNPTADKFVIELGLEKLSKVAIKLTDASGKVVLTDSVEPNSLNFKHNINIADYASGVYMLMITIDGKTAIKRVVKQ